ncbi:hypothetical protein P8C59_005536 [Phyllachora maydis]|uniref:Uncharacterized protein n=1 Tax=Phyllachora maydis TaxID=1825666 RepID=A0AAD9MDL3_9PEZI|nr:hypothetical protein P8C59_005536 [Phyllachora maydis]
MPADGGRSDLNAAGAAYGAAYCDAQSPVKALQRRGKSRRLWYLLQRANTLYKIRHLYVRGWRGHGERAPAPAAADA